MAPLTPTDRGIENDIHFTINGEIYNLCDKIPMSTTLLEYLRDFAFLRGTKSLCLEGGCGVCTVVATTFDHEKQTNKTFSVKSCQTLVYSCAGWIITTIEHLGNSKVGYSRLQVALKNFYGTQCGFCSPGFVMTMHGMLQKCPKMTMEQIEKAFDGNICRCTGYRPILDAFKCFALDAPAVLKDKLIDIEDAYRKICSKTGKNCGGTCQNGSKCNSSSINGTVDEPTQSIAKELEGGKWFRPKTVEEVLEILEANEQEKMRFVVGNTGQGVFKDDGPFNVFIDTSGVNELYKTNPSDFSIGANVSLNRCIELFHEAALNYKGFHHLEQVAKHWEVVANTGIRNVSCWAGNLMMKHRHPGFTSDIFTTLIAVDTKLKIASPSSVQEVYLKKFLTLDMSKSVILSLSIKMQSKNVVLRTFKITPRAVNAHAYVNAAFKFHLDFDDGLRVLTMPTFAFAGINPHLIRASNTEKYIVGKQLSNKMEVEEMIKILGNEIEPDSLPQDAAPEYRKKLSQCLLYKAILSIVSKTGSDHVASGGTVLHRPISSGQQTYDENQDTWPIGQALPKLESSSQISGEAEFLDDVAPLPNELYGAFVQTTVATGTIKSICAEECLKHPGVVDFITAKDIPEGKNTFVLFWANPDPVFVDKEVKYAGQAIGLVVAKSRKIAKDGAKLVKISYDNVTTPVLSIKESISQKRTGPNDVRKYGDVKDGFQNSKHIIKGDFSQGSQFHFTMEPLSARVVPIEDGFNVFCTTQWIDHAQAIVENILEIPANSINMQIRRIGGAYGGKATRICLVLAATAVAAKKLHRPVRTILTLTDHMTLVGWREPFYANYKVGFADNGELKAVEVNLYSDTGHNNNECTSPDAAKSVPNTYHCANWLIQPNYALTDTATNTFCRAPAITEGIATMENIMDHVAAHLDLDPVLVRERNLVSYERPEVVSTSTEPIVTETIFPLLKQSSELEKRKLEIKQFNEINRWKKRGIAMVPILYPIHFSAFKPVFNVQVVIYEHDGTVAIKHGGIEMGQGINTKVAQVAAKILNIPVDMIQVKPTDNFSGANSFCSGGSMASDINAHGVKICCEKIKKRMDAVAKEMEESGEKAPDWPQLVKTCIQKCVDVHERYATYGNEQPKDYKVWAAAVGEVEIDVLTGQYMILRTDIMEDCGRSMSPFIDIGQIEGAFIMGVGFMTSEKVKYNPATGQKISNGTWEYKVPTALDIPVDLRVTLMPKGDNPYGVARSKATGEPAVCLSFVIVSALREAITSARKDSGVKGWFEMNTPVTVDSVHELCNVQPEQFTI